MTTQAREYSETDIYHIYARANNRENIFSNKEDKEYYISLLKAAKEKYDVKIFAYAIMDNHLHILMKVTKDNLSRTMKFLQQSYTYYFNNKYKHSGRIFAQRFKSKACRDDIYLTELVKYIHLNPKKAGLDDDYMCSFTSHCFYNSDKSSFCDVNYILSYFSNDITIAREKYLDYLNLPYVYSAKDIYL